MQQSSSQWGMVGYDGHELKQGPVQTGYKEKLHHEDDQAVDQLPGEPVQAPSMEVLIVQSPLRRPGHASLSSELTLL